MGLMENIAMRSELRVKLQEQKVNKHESFRRTRDDLTRHSRVSAIVLQCK